MSDHVEPSPATEPARSARGQTLVEFALLLPMLLILFLGIADFGRVFQAGIVTEAAARNAAEIVAEEYRRNPPAPLSEPAPPGDPAFYGPLHTLGGRTACAEMRSLTSTRYDPVTGACHVADADPSTHDAMPVIQVCIHDGEDPLCGTPAFGASVPDPGCSELIEPMPNTMDGGAETSRYVEVRICSMFTTIIDAPILSLGDFWLQRNNTFTIADYPVPTPTPPPPPPPPSPTALPTPEPTPTPSATPEPTPTPIGEPTPTPSETATPTPCNAPLAAFVATPTSGKSPLVVTFTDTSTASGCPITSWTWVWADGTANGTTQHPTHTFTNTQGPPGNTKNFAVRLTVTSAGGSSQATVIISVQK